jgi:asparagine synthase (glutamine-hydrolysing)
MPGIFGFYMNNNSFDAEVLTEHMGRSMNLDGRQRADRYVDKGSGLALGRVSLGILNAVDQPVKSRDGQCLLVFHGELYGRNGASSDPEFVLERYLEDGDACVDNLNGIFHLAVLDLLNRKIKLFSDRFGLQPLYYFTSNKGILFGPEVKAVIQDREVSRKPDWQSFADFLHYGQILGDRTLFKDIRLLGPASILTYDMDTGNTTLDTYQTLPSLFIGAGASDPRSGMEETVSMLADAVQLRTSRKDILGLSLSGGLDSRGILAALNEKAKGLSTYTLGLAGCADEKLAEKMARLAGTHHEFILLDQSYITNFETMARDMIRLSDGMYHPHESTEMLALEYFKRAPFKILLRGHGGEIAKASLAYPVMATPRIRACRSASEVLDTIFEITNLVLKDIQPEKLFNEQFSEVMDQAPRQSLAESLGDVAENLTPADVCVYYYIREHIRRQVVASLDIFRTQIEIRMPYVDHLFIAKLLSLPLECRNEGEVHHELIRRCMPKLVKIPNSNTGAPLDAGPLRLFVTDKFNSLMKKLSVSGFRHYTEFQKWHRQGFKDSSEKIIFNERTADRGIYRMDYLKKIFKQHIAGERNCGHLLGTIVGLELWSREFADK